MRRVSRFDKENKRMVPRYKNICGFTLSGLYAFYCPTKMHHNLLKKKRIIEKENQEIHEEYFIPHKTKTR